MKVLAIPHEPSPLVLLEVFLPYGCAFSEQSFDLWRDEAWSTFAAAADERLRAAVEQALTVVPYSELVGTRDMTGHPDMPDPKVDTNVARSERAALLDRTDGTPCVAVFARNVDEYDPVPFILAWVTAVAIATREGGVVYAPRFGRLWDPRVEPMPKLASVLAIRDFVTFEASADEQGSFASTIGLPSFGIPDLTWDAPRSTDPEAMRNLVVGAASALARVRRSAGRRAPGQRTFDVPAMLPVLHGDIAAAYGLDVHRMNPAPDTLLAAVPLDISTALRLAIRTNASAASLNDWLGGIRERVTRIRFE